MTMLESLGNNLGLAVDVDDVGLVVFVSLQDKRPINRMSPLKYFMAKKYSFSCIAPKRRRLIKFEKLYQGNA